MVIKINEEESDAGKEFTVVITHPTVAIGEGRYAELPTGEVFVRLMSALQLFWC